jgi:hypothetical protein
MRGSKGIEFDRLGSSGLDSGWDCFKLPELAEFTDLAASDSGEIVRVEGCCSSPVRRARH